MKLLAITSLSLLNGVLLAACGILFPTGQFFVMSVFFIITLNVGLVLGATTRKENPDAKV